jgi:hypothetical protein
MTQGKLMMFIDDSILREQEGKVDELGCDKMHNCPWEFGYCSTVKLPEELNGGQVVSQYSAVEAQILVD